jgi:hypothetical protein
MGREMTRREWLKTGTIGAAAWGLGGARVYGQAGAGSPRPALKDRYLNPDAEPFDLPTIEGQRYEALVPDTLDLAEVARGLLHAMTAPTDPQIDHEVYWWVIFGTNPPRMIHQFSDQVQFQCMAVLPHMRLITGSAEGSDAERSFLGGVIRNLGPDGLYYNLPKARPWVAVMDQSFPPSDKPPEGTPFANLLQSCVLVNMLNTYMQISADERWKQMARRSVDTFIRLAVDKEDFAYYHKWQYLPGEPRGQGPVPKDFYRGWSDGIIMLSLLQHYHLTGYPPAEALAQKLMKAYLRFYTGYDGNGNLIGSWGENAYIAFPLWASLHPLEWGLRTGDPARLEMAAQYYERYRGFVEPSTGYVPEVLHLVDPATLHTAESCFLAYVIANAALLSAAGAGDYWDDVDRWVRNQFAEAQLRRVDWVDRLVKDQPVRGLPPYSTADNVGGRNIGAFAGAMQFNDWFGGYVHPVARESGGMAIQHCCTARSATAVYNVWKNIVHYEGGKLRVNLLLNRASKWADIDSHIPFVGQVDVKVKEPVNLSVRIPEWVKPQEVQAAVDGARRELSFTGRYAQVGDLRMGQTARLTFPIGERDQPAVVHGRAYTLRIRGNTVVGIDPPGHYLPVYQRAYYQEEATLWRKTERFVTNEDRFREDHALCI